VKRFLFTGREATAKMGKITEQLDEIYEVLEATLLNEWLWIIIGGMCAVFVLPFAIMMIMLSVPAWLSATITILVVVAWGIAAGYKDWSLYRRKSEEAKSAGKQFNPSTYDEYVEKRKRYRIRP